MFSKHNDHYKCCVMKGHRSLLLGYFGQSSLVFFLVFFSLLVGKAQELALTIFGYILVFLYIISLFFIGEFANGISALWGLNFIILFYFTNDFGKYPNPVFYYEKDGC